MSIAKKIRNLRKKRGLTQKELGKRLGILPELVSNYERGVRNPKIETLKKFARALGAPIYDLLDLEEA